MHEEQDKQSIPTLAELERTVAFGPLSSPRPTRRNAAIQHWHDYYRSYLDSFAKYGALTRNMLSVVVGHTPTTVRNALHQMSKAGYIQYHRTAGQVLYYLTKTGLDLTEYQRFARSPKEAFGLVRHDMVVNTILGNTIYLGHPPQHGLLRWLGPIEAKEELAQYYGFEETNRSKQLNYLPDAYFEYYVRTDKGAGLYPVVLEVDMGTESINRVLRKLETGVRTLAQKANARQHNIVWVFVGNESRFARVADSMHDRFLELKKELPSGRVPQIFIKFVEQGDWESLRFPLTCPEIETSELRNLTGYGVEPVGLEEFTGVTYVVDRIQKKRVLRTQILALGGEVSRNERNLGL